VHGADRNVPIGGFDMFIENLDQGRWCFGKTPMQAFLDAMPMTKEKMIAA
jgi:hypothetical protein